MRKAGRKPGKDIREAQKDQFSKPAWLNVWRPGERSKTKTEHSFETIMRNLHTGPRAELVGRDGVSVEVEEEKAWGRWGSHLRGFLQA